MPTCLLCLQQKELCKKSHIIPNFMYRELFDAKHRMVLGTPILGEKKDIQSGAHEGDLLCLDCDNRVIGGYEGYASQVLYGGKIPVSIDNVVQPDGLEITMVHGLDYTKFKLFLLSLLWRASISQQHFFSAVSLGPYEEKLRVILLAGDPGASVNYPCVMTSYKRTGLPVEVITAPRKSHLKGKVIYTFIICGMAYIFRITENERTAWILEATIKENGDMQIPHTPRDSVAHLFNKIIGQEVF